MRFQVDITSRTPIYRQLGDQLREAIARGKLAPGERLPSVRELSQELVVNPNTIARAYSELEREGLLHARQGLGVFVAEYRTDLSRKARRDRLLEALDRFLTQAVHLGFTSAETREIVAERLAKFQWTTPAERPPRETSK